MPAKLTAGVLLCQCGLRRNKIARKRNSLYRQIERDLLVAENFFDRFNSSICIP